MPDHASEKVDSDNRKNYTYISNQTRTTYAVYSFWAFLVLTVLIILVGSLALISFNTPIQKQTYDQQQLLMILVNIYDYLTIIIGLLYLACAIIFLCWLYRASNNTQALNPQLKIKFTPGWSIASYFIPILSFYWPYKAMKEMWLLCTENKKTLIILFWWLTFILMNIFSTAVVKLPLNNELDVQRYISLDTVSNVFSILSAFLAIKIIHIIQNGQVNKASGLK